MGCRRRLSLMGFLYELGGPRDKGMGRRGEDVGKRGKRCEDGEGDYEVEMGFTVNGRLGGLV